MKTFLTKSQSIPDGAHYGRIASVEYRFDPYKYIDLHLSVEDFDFKKEDGSFMTVKKGLPFGERITEKGELGKFLLAFGYKLEKEIDLDELKGKEVLFQTAENEKGFAEVISLKPKIR